jgi:hypothetical protein
VGVFLRPRQAPPPVPPRVDPVSRALATPAKPGLSMRVLPPSHVELAQIDLLFRQLGPRLPFQGDRMEFAFYSLADCYEAYRRWPPVIGGPPAYFFRAIPRLSRPPARGDSPSGVLILEDPLLGPPNSSGAAMTTSSSGSSASILQGGSTFKVPPTPLLAPED